MLGFGNPTIGIPPFPELLLLELLLTILLVDDRDLDLDDLRVDLRVLDIDFDLELLVLFTDLLLLRLRDRLLFDIEEDPGPFIPGRPSANP
jgi:hypothetical protein